MFEFDVPVKGSFSQKAFSLVKGAVEKSLLFDRLNAVYAEVAGRDDSRPFCDRALEALNVHCEVSQSDLARVPARGPVVVVANHPFGAIEAILLASVLRAARPDVKVLGDPLLRRIPEVRDTLVFADGAERETVNWVSEGHLLGVFPAAGVAHMRLHRREITDPPWEPAVARLVREAAAPVLPVYFRGVSNSLLHALGFMHPRLRAVMLPHELLNKRAKRVEMRVGNLIPLQRLLAHESDAEMTAYLRRRAFILASRDASADRKKTFFFPLKLKPAQEAPEPIAPPRPVALLTRDVDRLPAEQVLLESGDQVVLFAGAAQIPDLLHEIGRLREYTFRKTGEGTGRALDLDEFDELYAHLFVWNRKTKEVVGAYRLGHTDEILQRHGKHKLYTSTLFDYRPGLLERLSPALEMGRSFVRPEYQRSNALLLLWKGIGQYVLRNPRYKILFGPVSISNDYRPLSRQLIVEALKAHGFMHELAGLVRPRTPFRARAIKGWDARTIYSMVRQIDEVADLIADIESAHKGIPVLLKQYLKLGGKVLGFNVDPAFSDALDGLIMVDLTRTDRRTLDRFMGEAGAAGFHAWHEKNGHGQT